MQNKPAYDVFYYDVLAQSQEVVMVKESVIVVLTWMNYDHRSLMSNLYNGCLLPLCKAHLQT